MYFPMVTFKLDLQSLSFPMLVGRIDPLGNRCSMIYLSKHNGVFCGVVRFKSKYPSYHYIFTNPLMTNFTFCQGEAKRSKHVISQIPDWKMFFFHKNVSKQTQNSNSCMRQMLEIFLSRGEITIGHKNSKAITK